MPNLDDAQNRLAAALNLLERLENDPRADRHALHRARVKVGVWRSLARRLAREPYQRALALSFR